MTWSGHVKNAAIIQVRGLCVNSSIARVRLAGELELTRAEASMLKEELGIKDARMEKVDPRRRPYCSPTDRMAILELRDARGWSLAEAAPKFQIERETIRAWTRRMYVDYLAGRPA